MSAKKTLVGSISSEALTFTVGKDPVLDRALLEFDCLGTAAHVTMLSKAPGAPALFSESERKRVVAELVRMMQAGRRGAFEIRESDQDVHMAVERVLTARLGAIGKRIHTARSRNDQVAVDLRLYGKMRLCEILESGALLADAWLKFAKKHARVPMVGRTHLQPAMPSTVGLWASSHTESLLDDLVLVQAAFDVNDRNPLGSAAGYGTVLDVDRRQTTASLGFREPIANVLYAASARGKCESAILCSLSHVMLSLSRLAEDMVLYTMPEFGYFRMPREFLTGSSIMPQKNNPDVFELVRAKAGRVQGCAATVMAMVKGLPSGYNRDLQEVKELFMEGIETTRSCMSILTGVPERMAVDEPALIRGFTAGVFATDRVLERVAAGESFRDAYQHVKTHMEEIAAVDPVAAVRQRAALCDPGWRTLGGRVAKVRRHAAAEKKRFYEAASRLLGVPYPELK